MKRLFVLTGAGISAESGISTFRGQDGLWEGHSIEDVASPEGFEKNPNLVYDFYNLRREQLFQVQANPAHHALATLAEAEEVELTLVTQNVDDLHERAGSQDVIHMHGELRKARCLDCWHVVEHCGDLSIEDMCENCHGRMRPHIVWFGEMPFEMQFIQKKLQTADLFLSIGTSGNVYPAAGFVETAKSQEIPAIEFNLEATGGDLFSETILGKAGETLPAWVEEFVGNLRSNPF